MSARAMWWAGHYRGSKQAKAVLDALAWHANQAGEAFPSQAALADMTGHCERAVRSGLAELVSAGVVKVIRPEHRGAVYRLAVPEVPADWEHRQPVPLFGPRAKPTPAPVAADTGTGCQEHRHALPAESNLESKTESRVRSLAAEKRRPPAGGAPPSTVGSQAAAPAAGPPPAGPNPDGLTEGGRRMVAKYLRGELNAFGLQRLHADNLPAWLVIDRLQREAGRAAA